MKTLKCLIVCMLLCCGNTLSIYAQQNENGTKVVLKSYPIKTKDPSGKLHPGETPIKRSLQYDSVYATLYNRVIFIDFVDAVPTADITITNQSTGVTVYTGTSSNPTVLSINLNGESNGDYSIEIETEDACLTGDFSL